MAEQSKFWYLKNINVFEGMSDEEMSRIDAMARMSSVRPNQPIAFPDEIMRNIYVLKSGHVKISRIDSDGHELILEVVGPGEMFGELALLGDEEGSGASDMIQALDDVLICAFRRDMFEQMMRDNPDLTIRITKRIGLRLRKFEQRVTGLVFRDVRQRVLSFLLEYAEKFGTIRSGVVTIPMHLSHQEIAMLTGSARQTVTSTLNALRNEGMIDFSRSGIVIQNLDALKAETRN